MRFVRQPLATYTERATKPALGFWQPPGRGKSTWLRSRRDTEDTETRDTGHREGSCSEVQLFLTLQPERYFSRGPT